jgi:hypothetical protein
MSTDDLLARAAASTSAEELFDLANQLARAGEHAHAVALLDPRSRSSRRRPRT